jgi:ABC-type nitrate/sulfonate/bicarbonate transport system ATPase subunit
MFSKAARLSVLFLFCTVFTLSAQVGNYTLKLKLIEEGSGDAIEFATVSLTAKGATIAHKYALSDDKGTVTIGKIKKGTYTLKAELLGYKDHVEEITFDKNVTVDLGDVKMAEEVNALSGAVVSDVGNPIIVKKDTIEYQASSFKTTDNDMLEDLLKKLPGVQVSSDGSITVNGKTVSRITINGKTFFLNDPQLASKNIPANIVEKVKVLQKKSDEAEFTGIEDGNDETVIDLNVMKGMMNGWFGSLSGGGGYDLRSGQSDEESSVIDQSVTENSPRFQASGIVARFNEDNQLSFIGNANNTNNRGFTDMASSMMSSARGGRGMGGGGRAGFQGNGITTSYMTGFNGGKTFDNESEMMVNTMLSGDNRYIEEGTSKTIHQADGSTLLYNSNGTSNRETYNINAGGRGVWKVSKNTSFIFQPSFNFGWGSFDENETYNTNSQAAGEEATSNVNKGESRSAGYNNSKSGSGFLLWRQRLGKAGRTISLNLRYSLSDNDISDGLNKSATYTYGDGTNVTDSSIVDQKYNTNAKSYSLTARMTYNEPLGKNFFIQGVYSYGYSYNTSNKVTNDYDAANGTYDIPNSTYSNRIDNKGIDQRIGINFMKQEDKYNLTVGAAARPSRIINTTTYGDNNIHIDTLRWNFSPEARFDYDFTDYKSLRIRYRGNTTQPTVTQLQPVEDNSNPTLITRGNPGLVPTFSHNLMFMYNSTNMDTFSSFNTNLDATYNVNSIVNGSWDDDSGVEYTVPMNNDEGTFSLNDRLMFNAPIAKSKFSIMTFAFANYSKSLSYVGNRTIDGSDSESYLDMANYTVNHYQSLSAMMNLRGVYRNDIIEITLGGRLSYNQSWYDNKNTNVAPSFTDGISASVNATPGTWALVADANYTFYQGYVATYSDPTLVINASVAKTLFKGSGTVQVKVYDLLDQSKNLYRSIADNYVKDTWNNTLGRYVMLSFTYRFGTFKRPEGGRRHGRGMHGGPGGPGGFGGPPRF